MLVLSRKLNQEILIGDNIRISVLKIKGNTVRLGIEAPREVHVVRGELEPKPQNLEIDDLQPKLNSNSSAEQYTVVFSNSTKEGAKAEIDVVPYPNSENSRHGYNSVSNANPDTIRFPGRNTEGLQHHRMKQIVNELTNRD
ncbi:MAG: carbon storage regulator [Planctomycetota bacterium]